MILIVNIENSIHRSTEYSFYDYSFEYYKYFEIKFYI